MDEYKLTHGEYLLDLVELVLNDPAYGVRSGLEDAHFHYEVVTLVGMADAVALFKRIVRPGAHFYLFCSALLFGQWYRRLSRPTVEEDCDSDGGDRIATKEVGDKKKVVFEVRDDLLHYTPEVENMMTTTLTPKAHQVNVCEKAVHFWRKWSSCGEVLSHVNYKRHSKGPTRHP